MNARILTVFLASLTLAACNCGGGGGPDGGSEQIASRLAFTVQPSSAVAGANLAPAIKVAVQDDDGQTVADATGTITLALGANPGGGSLAGTLTANVVSGVATFSTLSLQKAAQGYTLAASASGLSGATSSAFDISAAAAAQLLFATDPSDLEAGGVISPAVDVRIEDAFGNLTSSTEAVTLALGANPGSATLSGTSTVNAVAGVARFSELSLDVAADGYTLAASAPSLTGITSKTFNVRPGTPTALAFTVGPSNATAGAALAPAVQVEIRDARGNRVRNATDTVTLSFAANPGGGSLGGTASVAAVNGVATFSDLSVARAAAGYSLRATSGTLTEAVSSTFDISAGAAATMAFKVQPSDTGSLSPITPAVEVAIYDALGNLSPAAQAITLALATSPSGASLTGTLTRTTVGGVATFNDLQVNLQGTYSLEASGPLGTLTSSTFSVAHGAPASISFTQQPTSAVAGASLAPAVTVTVRDGSGNIATSYSAPVTVTLQANAFGGVLGGTTTVAAINGVATFSGLSIQRSGTGYQLSASTGSLGPISSSAFNITAGVASALTFVNGPSTVTAGATMPTVRVGIVDAYGNATGSTASVALALDTNPAGATLSGGNATAASAGVATFAALSIARAGTGFTITATSSGLSPVTSAAFDVNTGAASTLVFSTQPVTTQIGQTLPTVRVSVRDAFGNDVTSATGNVTLALGSNPGGSTLGGTVTQAVSAGVATFSNLTVSNAATGYTLSASRAGLSPVVSEPFDIVTGPPSRVVFSVQPGNTTAGASIAPAVEVTVQDTNGNTVVTYSGTISLSLGSGSPSGATLAGTVSKAATNGVASFSNLSIAQAGSGYTLVANATSLSAITSNAFDINVGAASVLVFRQQPTSITAGATITPAVQVEVRDAAGNVVTSAAGNVTVAFGNNPGAGTLSGTKTVAASSGVASFGDLSVNRPGTGYTLTASYAALTPVTSAAFNVATGPASALVFTQQPTTTTAGATLAPAVTVTVRDASGNTVTSFAGTVSVSLGAGSPVGATLSGTTTVAPVSGVASFSNLSIAKAGTGYSLVAAASGVPSVTSSAFDINVGAANRIVYSVQPSSTVAGQAIAPAVVLTVQDSAGNTVTSASGNVTLTKASGPASGVLSGTTTRAASSGVATFSDLSLDAAGNYTLSAAYPGLTSVASSSFAISAGSASQLVFTVQPSNTTAGASITPAPAVAVRDAFGNTITSFSGTLSVAVSGGATLNGSTSVTASAGVASFPGLSIDTSGSYTLTASGASLTPVASSSFNITAGAANRVVVTQQPSNASAGATIAPAVVAEIRDALGNRVTGSTATVVVAFGNNPTGALLSGTLSRAAVAGVATFSNLAVDRVGTGYTLALSSSGLTGTTSSAFDIAAGSATRVAFVAQPSSAAAGASLGTITVAVQDAGGNVITGSTASITLALNSSTGAVLNGTKTQSAVNGVATFTGLNTNTAGTGYTLTATSTGLTSNTSSAFNVSAGSASQMVFSQQPGNIVAGASFAPSVAVQFQDSFGNPTTTATAVTLSFANDPTGGASLLGTTGVTSAAGVATFTGVSVDRVATGYTLRATSSVGSPITSAAFDVSHAAAAALVVRQQPTQTQAAAAITPAVTVAIVDSFGNTVTSSTAAIALAVQTNPASGTLTGGGSVAAVAGVATYSNLRLDRAGTGYTLRATSTGLPSVDTAPFNIVPGPAAVLRYSQQPSSAQVSVAIAPAITVRVEDASGNLVPSPAVSVALAFGANPSGATLGGTTSATTASGVATFSNITVSAVGTGYTLVASSAPLTSATSAAFNITATGAAGLVYTDPSAGGKIRLIKNTALSTPTTIVLDLVAAQTLTGYAVGFNLPVDTTRVVANTTLIQTGTALSPGSSPAAMIASIPTTGPLAGVLVTGQSQKATGTGAISTDSTVSSGAVFYRVRLDAKSGATAGVVFDGASLPAAFFGVMRDKAGTDVAVNADFRIGRLAFQ